MAFNNGVILINIGLIAQLENESQLAFIMAHEISHYINQDAVERYVEYDKISKGKGVYDNLSNNDKEIEQYKYSKTKEIAADEDGLSLFLKSDYNRTAIENVFDILKYSYLPIDEIPFDKTFLENNNYKIKDEFLLEELNPIHVEEDDDEKQTHPNASERKSNLISLLEGSEEGSNKTFIQSEKLFNEVRKTCRYELSRAYLKYGAYEEAIYNSYVLLQKYPNDIYLKKNVAKNLVAIAMHINNKESLNSKKINIEKDLQGESQQLYYIIKQMAKEDKNGFNVLALSYVYELYKENQKDKELEDLFKNLVRDMIKEGDFEYHKFKKTPPPVKTDDSTEILKEITIQEDSIKKEDIAKEVKGSKLSKINEKSKLEKIEKKVEENHDDTKLYLYGFANYVNDSLFINAFEENEKDIEREKKWLAEWKSMNKREKKKNYNPWGIEKVVVIDPFFAKISAKKKEKYKFFESESGEIKYTDRIEKIAQNKKLILKLKY